MMGRCWFFFLNRPYLLLNRKVNVIALLWKCVIPAVPRKGRPLKLTATCTSRVKLSWRDDLCRAQCTRYVGDWGTETPIDIALRKRGKTNLRQKDWKERKTNKKKIEYGFGQKVCMTHRDNMRSRCREHYSLPLFLDFFPKMVIYIFATWEKPFISRTWTLKSDLVVFLYFLYCTEVNFVQLSLVFLSFLFQSFMAQSNSKTPFVCFYFCMFYYFS